MPGTVKTLIARAGFEPASRAHEAREERRSSTAQSGRQASNLRHRLPKPACCRLHHSQEKGTWEAGLGSRKQGQSRSWFPAAIRYPSVRLPATVAAARGMPSLLLDAGSTLRPTLCAAVVPSLPLAVRVRPASVPEYPRRESNPRFRVENPASCR